MNRYEGVRVNRMLTPLFVLVWSSGYLAGTIGAWSVPPLALVAWRFLLAATLLAAVALATRAPWPRGRRAWRDLVVTGLLLQGVQFGAAYTGLALGIPAGLAAMILSLSPVVVAVLGGPLFGERLGPWGWAGSALAVAGTVVAGAAHLGDGGGLPGIGCAVLGLAGFAAGMLYQKRIGATMDLRTGNVVQLLAGVVVVVPAALLTGQGLAPPLTASGISAAVWLAVVNSVGGVTLLFVMLRRRAGAAASSPLYLVPPVTAVLAVPLLGQPVGPETLAGLVVSAAGVLLLARPAPVPAAVPR
jgi:drug/metabolite transporter (DMT)-like permease